jgi:hypothetical protein
MNFALTAEQLQLNNQCASLPKRRSRRTYWSGTRRSTFLSSRLYQVRSNKIQGALSEMWSFRSREVRTS